MRRRGLAGILGKDRDCVLTVSRPVPMLMEAIVMTAGALPWGALKCGALLESSKVGAFSSKSENLCARMKGTIMRIVTQDEAIKLGNAVLSIIHDLSVPNIHKAVAAAGMHAGQLPAEQNRSLLMPKVYELFSELNHEGKVRAIPILACQIRESNRADLRRVLDERLEQHGYRHGGGSLIPAQNDLSPQRVTEERVDQAPCSPDYPMLDLVLVDVIEQAENSWADIGKRVLRRGASKCFYGRLHLEAKRLVDSIHGNAVSAMVEAISKFAKKKDIPLGSVFQRCETRFEDLHARAVRPVQEVARVLLRGQTDLLNKQMDEARRSFAETARRARTAAEFEVLNMTERRPKSPMANDSRKVFVVHGHDVASREQLARFLERLKFEPIILHERPNSGRTIIEKFEEDGGDVGFAVVLLTPDDEGGPRGGDCRPRARQNVVFELGYFTGRLGRERVCALKLGDVEIPSDLHGIVYVELDEGGGWRVRLATELETAGFKFDWGLIGSR